MARKKKGNTKANPRLYEIQEDVEHELRKDALLNGQQRILSLLSDSPLTYPSPDNELATTPESMGRSNRGKGRADLLLSEIQEKTSHELSVYQPNYQQLYEEDPMSFHRQPQASTSSRSLVQYPPPNLSRDGPSGGFFEGSSGIEIKGGKFNQTYGHHTNVTIHVNQPREEDDTPPQHMQHSFAPPFVSASQPPSHNVASPPAQDVHRGQFSSTPLYEQGPSTPIHNIASPLSQDIHHGQISSMGIYEQGPSISTMMYAPDNSNKIYERHLGLKQRGFPLWIPEPSRRLPMPYRRKGVHVGDVGIITPSGAFSFLFNICLPADHPINPRTLPEGFAPIYPPIEPMDIREHSEFKFESYLASTAIEKINNDPPFRGLSFVTSAAEGAVLTFPDGAVALDLENIPRFRAYAAANIESWYRYVNGPRGREAKNGEVRLVIGCDKATSWGMATVANMTQHKTHYLKWRSVADGVAAPATIPLYKWEYTGLGEARVGPDLPEIVELRRNDDSNVALEGKYWNQCLFMRTLNLTLSEEVFAAISRELEAALVLETQQFQIKGGSSSSTSGNSPSTSAQTGSTSQQLGTRSAHQTSSAEESSGSATTNLPVGEVAQARVTTTRSPSAPKSHPSDVLNKQLSQIIPNCRVVITQDEDWCSVVNEDDEIMPSPSEIAERVLAAHHIREENGIVFLEPKMITWDQQSALRRRQLPSKQSIKDNIDLQNHMARSSRLTATGSTSLASRGSELAWRPPSRTGSLNTSAALGASPNIFHLQTVSDPEPLVSSARAALRETQNVSHVHSRTTQFLKFVEYYKWPFAALAVVSFLVQVVQLGDISRRQMAFCEILERWVTFAFDVEIALAIFNTSATWSSFLHPVETRINLVSAVVSTVIQLPIIHRSRLYSWLSFSQMLRMHRVPIAIPRMRRFLITFSGHLYRQINMALFLVVGNAVGVVYLLRNVIGSDSFGPKLSHVSTEEVVVAFCGILCLTANNVFVYNVFRKIYLGKIDTVGQQPSIPSRIHDLQPGLRRSESRLSVFIENLRQRFRSATNTQEIPMYNLVGNSDESMMLIFPRNTTRSARHPLEDTTMMRSIYAMRTLCRRLVKPPNTGRLFGVPPSPILQLLFEVYIILAIIANVVVSFIATPSYRSQHHHEPILDTWFGKADFVFVSSLLVEFIVKIMADGIFTVPNGYFSSVRNWLDFLVLLGSEYGLAASFASTNSMGTFSRSLRALSVLRLITISKTIQQAIATIFNSTAGHVFDATALAILYVLPYGIWNIKIFFSGTADATNNSELNFALFNFMPCMSLMTLLISILERVTLSTSVNKSKRDWKELRTYVARQVFDSPQLYMQRISRMARFLGPFRNRIWSVIVNVSLVAIVILFVYKSLDLAFGFDPSRIIAIAYFLATAPPLVDVFVHSYARHSTKVFIFDTLTAIGNFGSTPVVLYLHKDGSITGLLLHGVFLPGVLFKLLYPKKGFRMFMNVVSSSSSAIFGFLGLWLVLLTFNTILLIEVFGLSQLYMEAPLRTDIEHIVAMFTLWGSGKNWNQHIDSCDLQLIPSFPSKGCNSRAWVYTLFILWTFINSYISVQAFICVLVEKFSHFSQFFGKTPRVISTSDIEAVNRLWSNFCNPKTGRLERQGLSAFLFRLDGAFEVRCYPRQYSIKNIMRRSRRDGASITSSRVVGEIDLAKLGHTLRNIDQAEIERRKKLYAGIYYEANLQTEMRDGITFTQMLMILSYHKFVIDKSQSLSLQENVERSVIDEKVYGLICLDRLQSLLKTIVYRRRFLKYSSGRREYVKKNSDPLPSLLYILEDIVKSSESKQQASFKNTGSQLLVPIHSPSTKSSNDGNVGKDMDLIDVLFPPSGLKNDPKEISSNKKLPSVRLPSYVGSNVDTL